GRGALFFRQIVDAVGSVDDREVLLGLWELVWAGLATNDTLAPLRGLVAGGARARRPSRPRRGRRGPPLPSRMGPPAAAGRWSLLLERTPNSTLRLHALAGQLLARHGGLTRPAVVLVDGRLVLYVEKGGRTVLTFSDEEAALQPAVDALTLAVRDGFLGRIAVERADGGDVFDTPLAALLAEAGFTLSPRGLR